MAAYNVPGIKLTRYQLGQAKASSATLSRRYEMAVLHGQAALREALRLRQDGFNPDLIVGHSGSGNTLYLKRFGQTPSLSVISNGSTGARSRCGLWEQSTTQP